MSRTPVLLRLGLEQDKVYAEVQSAIDNEIQTIATFPASNFPGEPTLLRVGKTHGIDGLDDHSDGGPEGCSTVSQFRVFGRKN